MSSPNQHIIDSLKSIAEVYRSQGVIHKYKAYRTAMDTLKGLPNKITNVSEVKNLKGIGKAMEQKISEILATGHLQQEQDALADPINAATKLFTEIHGVGPVLAKKLVHDYGFRTLDDLENATVNLPPQVRMGLKYHEEASKRIPYDEIEEHIDFVKTIVHEEVDKKVRIECCGSHRRSVATSGDIDLLITHPASRSDSGSTYTYVNAVVDVLQKKGYIIDTLVHGNAKFMGYCRLTSGVVESTGEKPIARRLDLRFIAFDSFFPALMYFTGSDLFNIHMRQDALKLGYTINEYGVYKLLQAGGDATGAPVPVSPGKDAGGPVVKGDRVMVLSEEAIFELLGRKYVAPKDRCA